MVITYMQRKVHIKNKSDDESKIVNSRIIYSWEWGNPIDKASQTNPDSQPRSESTLEIYSRAASSVGITSPFQWSQHRKQFSRKAAHKKDSLKGLNQGLDLFHKIYVIIRKKIAIVFALTWKKYNATTAVNFLKRQKTCLCMIFKNLRLALIRS